MEGLKEAVEVGKANGRDLAWEVKCTNKYCISDDDIPM